MLDSELSAHNIVKELYMFGSNLESILVTSVFGMCCDSINWTTIQGYIDKKIYMEKNCPKIIPYEYDYKKVYIYAYI